MSGVIFHEGRPLAPLPDPAHVKSVVLQITAKLQHQDLFAAWSPAHSAYQRGHLDGWHEGFRAASGIEAATAVGTTEIGPTEGESPVPKADAQRPPQ